MPWFHINCAQKIECRCLFHITYSSYEKKHNSFFKNVITYKLIQNKNMNKNEQLVSLLWEQLLNNIQLQGASNTCFESWEKDLRGKNMTFGVPK
jgi:hypothetical protein